MTSSDRDPIRDAWQRQPREKGAMFATDIHARAASLAERSRRNDVLTAVVFGAIVVGNVIEMMVKRSHGGSGLGAALTAVVAGIAVVAMLYRIARRPATGPEGYGGSSLEFCRAELERQRKMIRGFWLFVLFFAPGLALTVTEDLQRTPMTPARLLTLGVGATLWVACIVWMIRREARRVRKELESLGAASGSD
jgi:hypothetical protein